MKSGRRSNPSKTDSRSGPVLTRFKEHDSLLSGTSKTRPLGDPYYQTHMPVHMAT